MTNNSQAIIAIFGAITAFFVWLQWRTRLDMKDKDAKLETLETNQIKIQSEADKIRAQNQQQQTQLDTIREQSANFFKSQEQWQQVINTFSQRTREGHSEVSQAMKDNTAAIIDLKAMMEIQATQYGNLSDTVKTVGTQADLAAAEAQATRKVVTDEITQLKAGLNDLRKDLSEYAETLESNIDAQQQRHTDNHIAFSRIDEKLTILDTRVSSIQTMLTPPPKPPKNEIPLGHPTKDEKKVG